MSKPSENRRTLGQESSRGVVAHTPTIRPDNDRPLSPNFFWEYDERSLSVGAHFLLALCVPSPTMRARSAPRRVGSTNNSSKARPPTKTALEAGTSRPSMSSAGSTNFASATSSV